MIKDQSKPRYPMFIRTLQLLLSISWLPLSSLMLTLEPPALQTQGYVIQPPPHEPLVVMNLAAHPDDEDGQTLAYYRWNRNAITYSVIFSRGEGGQNEIGPELYEKLAAIRSMETERAARILGTQVYFLNFRDFGYSKFAWETFQKWGSQDTVIARLVYLIRRLKPDVLFTNHDTVTVGPNRQHGHHQAVGLTAYAAFMLAADSTYHPEQFQEPNVHPWQPARLFVRDFSCTNYDVAVPVGHYDPELRKSYADLAMEALKQHRSQGMPFFVDRFRAEKTCFTLYRSTTDAPLDSTDLAAYLPPNRQATPDLSYWIDSGRLPAFPDSSLHVDDHLVVRGQHVKLTWASELLPAGKLWRWSITGAIDTVFHTSSSARHEVTLSIPPKAFYTYPRYVYQYQRYLNHPPLIYLVTEEGTHQVLAAGYLPVEIAPPLFLESPEPVTRIFPGPTPIPYRLYRFDSSTRHAYLTLTAVIPGQPHAFFHRRYDLRFDSLQTEIADTLRIVLPDTLHEGTYLLALTALPTSTLGPPETAHLQQEARLFDVHPPRDLHVGVIKSYDNTLPRALEAMDISYVMLDSTALAERRFDDLHTILIDIRAYLVRPDLRMYNDHLLQWVRQGGHLVVSYQKVFEWNPEYPDPFRPHRKNPGTFAPYPLLLGRRRVTFEDAPVHLLFPEHPLFHTPEPIGPSDWEGWVQERGLYFPEQYAPPYLELIETHDPGEPPLKSGILLTSYGQGTYLYTSLALYRQLRIYHPGAFRLFTNIISLPMTR